MVSILCGGCAISFFQQAGAGKEVGMATLEQGIVLHRTGQWAEAIENFSKAIQVSKEYNDVKLEAKALLKIGIVFRQLGLLYLAIDHFQLTTPALQNCISPEKLPDGT